MFRPKGLIAVTIAGLVAIGLSLALRQYTLHVYATSGSFSEIFASASLGLLYVGSAIAIVGILFLYQGRRAR